MEIIVPLGPALLITAVVLLCVAMATVIHVAYLGWLRKGFGKKGWLKYEFIGSIPIAASICTLGAANPFRSKSWYLVLCAAATYLGTAGFMIIHLSSLRLLYGAFEKRGWLGYELTGWAIAATGVFLLLVSDPLTWQFETKAVYALTLVGFVTFAAGGLLVKVGDRKVKGTRKTETMEKCHLCTKDLYRAGQPEVVGGHPFCQECFRKIEQASSQESMS